MIERGAAAVALVVVSALAALSASSSSSWWCSPPLVVAAFTCPTAISGGTSYHRRQRQRQWQRQRQGLERGRGRGRGWERSDLDSGTVTTTTTTTTSTSTSTTTALGAQRIPVLDKWTILRSGAATGVVSNHPELPDGDLITTSRLADPTSSAIVDGAVVVTESGSRYRLGASKNGSGNTQAKARARAAAARASPVGSTSNNAVRIAPAPTPARAQPRAQPKAQPKAQPNAASAAAAAKSLQQRQRQAKIEYNLSGKTIGGNRYLLCSDPQRSTSGKSRIYAAYRADTAAGGNLPTGNVVTVKLSPNVEAIRRESDNYDKVTSGLFRGRFVTKIEYLPDAGGDFAGQAALILETGRKNLKSVMSSRMNRGLSGKAMRNAAASAAQCIQAMHTSALVWTDLKAENFVVLPDSVDMAGMVGIDLESAIPHGGNPVDYSPEACPPEFADALLSGRGADFVLDYSYDVWSYGMLLFELNTGKGFFSGKGDSAITKVLRSESFVPNLDPVEDAKLRDLIGQCLRRDPTKRPGFAQILLHPYFLTTGFGPFSF